jgi:nucleotide-binding universal stress UspA family protein
MKKMLVPLDGSQASEVILPTAGAIAKACGYEMILFSAWDIGLDAAIHDQERVRTLSDRGQEYLRTYLRGVAKESEQDGIRCDSRVGVGHPAVEILAAITGFGVDLLAMGTHGRRAKAEGRRGSVADKVLRASTVPVLAVGPWALADALPVVLRRILVPLDGSAASESGLALALDLAGSLGAEIALVNVLPHLFDHYGPGFPEDYLPDIDRRRQDSATEYLRRLQSQHPQVIKETYVLPGLPQAEIPAFLERSPYDLVVMASRSRYRADLWTVGGVADLMIEGLFPVVIVPPTTA